MAIMNWPLSSVLDSMVSNSISIDYALSCLWLKVPWLDGMGVVGIWMCDGPQYYNKNYETPKDINFNNQLEVHTR